jgi:hypothetical protein
VHAGSKFFFLSLDATIISPATPSRTCLPIFGRELTVNPPPFIRAGHYDIRNQQTNPHHRGPSD